MKNPFAGELVVVFWCVLCGCASGIWYDFFKAIRKKGANSFLVVTIQDTVFWIVETIGVYIFLFIANNGILRWYEFFFIAFGFLLYRWLLSDFVVFVWGKFFSFLKGILKVLFLPLKILLKTVEKYKKIKLGRFIRRILKKQR